MEQKPRTQEAQARTRNRKTVGIMRIQEPERQVEPGPGVAASATPAESDMTMHGVEQ